LWFLRSNPISFISLAPTQLKKVYSKYLKEMNEDDGWQKKSPSATWRRLLEEYHSCDVRFKESSSPAAAFSLLGEESMSPALSSLCAHLPFI
jgi:hypothetical protein